MPSPPLHADNITTNVIELVRPYLQAGDCLIVTGFTDLLSSLSIIMGELDPAFRDPVLLPRPRIRLAYGVDTASTAAFGGTRRVQDDIKEYFLHNRGLIVENAADLKAVLAIAAIERREIDIRVYDPAEATSQLGLATGRMLHAKLVTSPLGTVAGSANFSRAGLYHNVEYADNKRCDSNDPETVATARFRIDTAEKIWNVSADCNEEVLEGLRQLLRTVTPEDAMCRCVAEQRGLRTWRIDLLEKPGISEFDLYPYQLDMIYEAAHAAYEHGIVFLCAPAGSGKTQIGKHLAYVLSTTFRHVIREDMSDEGDRSDSAVIVPPRVFERWKRKPKRYQPIRNSRLDRRENIAAMKDRGIHIVDESHTLLPRLVAPSKRAKIFETAPPAWTVCLSATPIGNFDVDWLIHAQEKRASIFMPPDYVASVRAKIEHINSGQEPLVGESVPVTWDRKSVMLPSFEAVGFLPAALRDWAVELLDPCTVLRTRADIGEQPSRKRRVLGIYPRLIYRGRHPVTRLSKRERDKIDEIEHQLTEIPGLAKKLKREITRLGDVGRRALPEDALAARNLMCFIRMCPAVARWEMEHGEAGRNLRRIETKSTKRRKTHQRQGQKELFPEYAPSSPNPICDRILEMLKAPIIQRLSGKCLKALRDIQKNHDRVVVLAERVLPLLYYAEQLNREGIHKRVCVITSGSERYEPDEGSRLNALTDILGITGVSFEWFAQGHRIEPLFSHKGEDRVEGSASVFMTYQMAEGVNLQSCDTLVCLGVASSMVQLVQGLGRVDRIDSPYKRIFYYLVDIPSPTIPSDTLSQLRLKTNRALTGREPKQPERQPTAIAKDPAEAMCSNALDFVQERGRLRDTSYHDILRSVRRELSASRYAAVSRGVDRRNGIVGTWGAELALLSEGKDMTVFSLRGREDKGNLSPPRLLAVAGSGWVQRNQVACARMLADAYRETKLRGEHVVSPRPAMLNRALSQLVRDLPRLKEWHLRPERTVSGLRALVRFLWPEAGSQEGADERFLGELSLDALEDLFETWTRLLDPAWIKVKAKVREAIKSGLVPGFTSYREILNEITGTPEEDRIRSRMHEMLEAQRARYTQDPIRVTSRISVVFVSA